MSSMANRDQIAARLLLIAVPAAALAAVDLTVKATHSIPPWYLHQRTNAWVALSIALLVGVLELARIPSRTVALAAGVMSGGVLGNLLSARWNDNRVPNPLRLGDGVSVIAFNLADVWFLVGNLMLMASLMIVTIRHRDRLIPPREWERALRRRLRG
jgi:hypothetical protein